MNQAAETGAVLRSAWPDARQQVLLQASVGNLDRAEESFARWNAGTDWSGDIDPASYRLLPLVYARLRRVGSEHPEMPRLRGIYRHSWCEAQAKMRASEYAILALNAAGITVMASKGLAMITAHYETPALRPMSDVDLYVPRRQLAEAIAALDRAGWHISDPRADRGLRDMAILYASATLWHDQWGELDLHWRLMANVLDKPVIARFWKRSKAARIGRAYLQVPAPDDLLLHVVAHGVLSNALSPIRWIPDAVTILDKHGSEFDWPQLTRFASRHWLGWRLARGLRYVRTLASVDVPETVLRYRPRLAEKVEHRVLLEPPGGKRPFYAIYVAMALLTARIARDEDRRHLPRLLVQSMARRVARVIG